MKLSAGSGLPISQIAVGTWTFAGDKIWGDSERSQCIRVVHAALDQGINLFDTAPNYGDGRSEEILGEALAGRSDALVATKFKIDGRSETELRNMVGNSLRRLKRDHIDLMQIHWPGATPGETSDALNALEKIRQDGDIRYIGACNFGSYDLKETEDFPIVSNQLPYSLLWRTIENEIADASLQRELKTIAYSPLQQGLLSGRYSSLDEYPESRKRTRHFSSKWPETRHSEKGMEGDTESTLKRLQHLSEKLNHPLLEMALAFVLSRPYIDTVLVGARTEAQLHVNCRAAELKLVNNEIQMLEEATEDLRTATGGNPDMYQSESRTRFQDL
jgi:myo-inositol catabolism protein IolS